MKSLIYFPYSKDLIPIAKKLRSNMTAEEKKLWQQHLSGYPLRFARQKVIGNFILDFYCARCKLGVEIDGRQHETAAGKGRDEERTNWLNGYGITVIRFSNEQVNNGLAEVCRLIDEKVKKMNG